MPHVARRLRRRFGRSTGQVERLPSARLPSGTMRGRSMHGCVAGPTETEAAYISYHLGATVTSRAYASAPRRLCVCDLAKAQSPEPTLLRPLRKPVRQSRWPWPPMRSACARRAATGGGVPNRSCGPFSLARRRKPLKRTLKIDRQSIPLRDQYQLPGHQ